VQIELRELGDNPGAMKPVSAKNGDPVAIRFDAKDQVRKTMQVSVYMGDKTVRQTFEIRAGETNKEVRVPLE